MLAANELRMGSLIEKDNVMYKFLSLEQNHASTSEYRWYWVETLDGKLGKYYSSHFNPIPLTPEILEKCGLKNGNSELDRNVFYSTNKHLAQFSVNISGSFGIYVGVFIALRSVHLEYLHQLQNLYFALTNEELNYTP